MSRVGLTNLPQIAKTTAPEPRAFERDGILLLDPRSARPE